MSKKDWKKQMAKMVASKGIDPYKISITPYRDWRVVVIVFFVGLAVSFALNIYMFIQISQDSFFMVNTRNKEKVQLNKAGLLKVINNFGAKESMSEKLRSQNMRVVDPSL